MSLPLGALTPLFFAVATSAACGVLYPLLRRRLARIEPSARSRYIGLLASAPVSAAALLTGLTFLPSIVTALWPALDHCRRDGSHLHLCIVHPPEVGIGQIGELFAAASMGAVFVLLLQHLMRLLIASSLLRRLTRAARRHAGLGAYVVDSAVPFAFTGGALDVRVFVSSALLEALEPMQVEAIAAHEQHHVQARHPLWRGIVSLLSWLHMPWVRRALTRDFELAAEQSSDEVAARRVDSRPLVAKTILDVHRLARTQSMPGIAFGSDHISERVASLLSPGSWLPGTRGSALVWLAFVATALILSEPIHHLAETVLSRFAS